MLVQIMCNHPIATMAPPEPWNKGLYECDVSLSNVEALGEWLTARVGFKFDYRRGASRFDADKGRCVFFPARPRVGVHAMWVELVST